MASVHNHWPTHNVSWFGTVLIQSNSHIIHQHIITNIQAMTIANQISVALKSQKRKRPCLDDHYIQSRFHLTTLQRGESVLPKDLLEILFSFCSESEFAADDVYSTKIRVFQTPRADHIYLLLDWHKKSSTFPSKMGVWTMKDPTLFSDIPYLPPQKGRRE